MRVPLLALLLALASAAPGAAQLPPADGPGRAASAPLPRAPRDLADDFASTTRALHAAIDRWRRDRGTSTRSVPADVAALGARQQRIVRHVAHRPRRLRATVAALPSWATPLLRDAALAHRELASIHSVVVQRPRIRVGPAQPPDVLRRHYRAAWRRFGVGWPVLAAVNFVESRFGRLRNESVSGARGPMQFMPATWRAYGMGGDVRDPRDAILGAANYLRASGAPRDYRRALYAYNPSSAYVSAVLRHARRIRADRRVFYAYWSWPVPARRR